jgi:AcrR family transcriptional regulator
MGSELNSVKEIPERQGYHHGALREALIGVAESLIDERGLEGFSLRETARRAGVSPAAPAHHFGDTRGLLTAVAAAAFRRFGEALEAANHTPDLRVRLKNQAAAYLRFALAERAKFKLMWRVDLIDRASPEYSDAVRLATDVLLRAHRDAGPLAGEAMPYTDVRARVARLKDPALAPAVAVWSLVHGFSDLAIDGVFGREDEETGRGPEALLGDLLDRLVI